MSISQIHSEFDEFLYAPIDSGSNGVLLSVFSALARQDVDPWQEAASLARMSRQSAAQRLAALISALPGGPLAHLDISTIAARLVALLPRRANFNVAPRETLPRAGGLTNSHAVTYLIIINVIFLMLAFGGQYSSATHKPPARAGRPNAPAAPGTAVPVLRQNTYK